MERFELSRVRRNPHSQHRRAGVQRRRAQQRVHATGVHPVAGRSHDREISNQIG